MKVKFLLVILVVFIISIITFTFYSCEGEPKVDCSKVCKKDIECGIDFHLNYNHYYGQEESLDECILNCKQIYSNNNNYIQVSFFDQVNMCYEKECGEIIDCLISDAPKSCKTPDYTSLIDTICGKKVECKKITSKEKCVYAENANDKMDFNIYPPNKCLTNNYYSDLVKCINIKGECDTLEEDIDNCIFHPY